MQAHVAVGGFAAAVRTVTAMRRPSLDGLRALAALSVVCFHVWLYGEQGTPNPRTALGDKVLFEANLGLICFFVLSGYLLYRSFARAAVRGGRPVDLRIYALRRLSRILPAYYGCIAGCLLLFGLAGYADITPEPRYLPLFGVLAQGYSHHSAGLVNPVTWTLCVEAAFYLVLPLLGLLALRLGPSRPVAQVAVLVGLVVATAAWHDLARILEWDAIAWRALPSYLGHFAFGMLTAVWVERRRAHRPGEQRTGVAGTAALALAGVALVVANGAWHETAPGTPVRMMLGTLPAALGFALLIAAAETGRGPAVGWLSARPLAAVGLVSYGLYLWHLPLILVVATSTSCPSPTSHDSRSRSAPGSRRRG
jgi:peptidoglycan/LPS O-acetylase OafA/YrhL